MTCSWTALAVIALAIGAPGMTLPAGAKDGPGERGSVPIGHDLQQLRESDLRLGIQRHGPGFEPNVRPWNPAGIVGYSGPPWGTYGDTVTNVGPLPPGNPLNEQ